MIYVKTAEWTATMTWAVLLLGIITSTASAQNCAERLGYPKESRLVILEAREVGTCWEANKACAALAERKMVSSVGVLSVGPWLQDFSDWAKAHRDIDIGVTVALSNPLANLQWRPLSAGAKDSTLVDADGHPWKSVLQVATNISAEDAAGEIEAQIREAKNAGINITHLSGYHGTVFSRPDLAAVFLALAQKHWLPAPVVEITAEHIERFEKEGFPIDDEMIQLIRNYRLPKIDDIQLVPTGDTYEQKRERFCQLLQQLKPGITQIAFQPAVASEGLQKLDSQWEQRTWEARLLSDPKVAECVNQQHIVVTNWIEIMNRFNGLTGETNDAKP